jgi:hypothetical protein
LQRDQAQALRKRYFRIFLCYKAKDLANKSRSRLGINTTKASPHDIARPILGDLGHSGLTVDIRHNQFIKQRVGDLAEIFIKI